MCGIAGGVRFHGHSDTEVLLHGLRQWGTDCLGRLEGMYAFAWLDRVSASLLLARDPLGIKPLYVSHAGGRLFFASEVRALLATGQLSDAPDQREGPVAAETARAFGLPHDVLWLEQKDALDAVLPWLDALDQPSLDGLNTFVISRRARAAGFKVALSGQGGDELFGGYPSFADVPALLRGLRWLDWLPAGSVPKPNASDGFIDRGQLADLPIQQRDAVHGVSMLESRFYLGNTLLPVGDSTGMAHGLEIRVPMLDRPLLDLALSLPGAVRLPKGKADKSLLRRGFPDLLRPALLHQSKRGFVIPVRRWMKGELRQVCETALDVLRAHPQFNEKAVSASWNHFLAAPESPMWSRVWLLVALGWYLRRLSAVS